MIEKRQILEIDRTWSGVRRDVVCTRKLQITDDRQNLKRVLSWIEAP